VSNIHTLSPLEEELKKLMPTLKKKDWRWIIGSDDTNEGVVTDGKTLIAKEYNMHKGGVSCSFSESWTFRILNKQEVK